MKKPAFRPVIHTLVASLALSPMSSWAGVNIAQQPLSVAEATPPNIWFIIDDSGSMGSTYMGSSSGVSASTYTRNTIYYNPFVTYEPWYNADGTQQAAADRTKVSNSTTTTSLAGSTNLTSSDQYFLVPRNSTTGDTGNDSLYRWVLKSGGSTAQRCNADGTGCSNQTSFSWTADGSTISRTIAQEWQNYANWYHYYRTRMKMAKASVSRAFSSLDSKFRVGYTTIWNNNRMEIPVGTNNGSFSGANKTSFYTKLFGTAASGNTPLRQSLDNAGQYFSRSDAAGPYGPESGKAQRSCRQNFTILTTDGEWNSNEADTVAARANVDSTDGPTITNPKTGQSYTYKAEFPYKDKETKTTSTLADVAMYYWKNDLRDDLDNNVPTSTKNPAFWQHMRTFGISIGLKGTVDPAGPYPAAGWAAPSSAESKIDDLLHATINSRGQFVVASDPQEFTKALTDTLNAIVSETKSEASGGTNSVTLTSDTKVYFSRYTSGSWNGDIIAYPVNATTGQQDQTLPSWEAEKKLPTPANRNIYVNAGGTAKTFIYSNLTAGQKTHLTADLVSYLRGDRSKETDKTGGTLRERAGVLPAFINSQLVYVGAPEQGDYYKKFTSTSASAYAAYATAKATRTPTIYIAGNNGMLHAFNADTGVETYAFLPNSSITAKLADYADKDYGSSQSEIKPHQYILDGELTVADAYLDDAWKTILVGTQGRGGTGVFALDVTDPANITFLWEKSASDNSALGNNLGKPVIAQVADGSWRVILGNGPNSNGDKAQLLMFNLKTGAITAVDTGAGTNNGLAAVNAWDSDGDGFFDTAYAGDLQGNVWRFKNLGGTPASVKLFAGSSKQPITAQPLVIKNQKTGATWVTVGSGRYLNKDDLDSTKFETQTWYGLIDTGSPITARTQLKERKLLASGAASGVAGRTLEAGTETEITMSTTTNRGWYIDFKLPANKGERMMTPNFILGSALFGISYTPDASDPCQPNGTSSIWAINPFTGGRINQGVFDVDGNGSVGSSDKIGNLYPSVLDGLQAITSGAPPMNKGTSVGSGGGSGGSTPPCPNPVYIQTPSGTIPICPSSGQPSRQSWREVINQ